jgi:nucleotide-binding universal stress UspA family protein
MRSQSAAFRPEREGFGRYVIGNKVHIYRILNTSVFERILVPTDGSDAAAAALDHALALAAIHDASIDVLHVINTRHYDLSIESAREPLAEKGERFVQQFLDDAEAAGVPATGTVEDGRPARRILEYADEHGIDLIVMGTAGRGDLENRILGSVTEYVVGNADVPVQTVRRP